MRSEKTVFLLRHGETPSNISGAIQGPDEPLTGHGRWQAECLGLRLARAQERHPIKIIFSSTFLRARETAEIISLHLPEIPIVESWLFHECLHPSRIRGLPIDDPEVVRTLAEFSKNFHNPDFNYEDGETFTQRKERALAAIEALEEYDADNIALVTHGIFSTFFINGSMHKQKLTSRMIERAPMIMDNASITKMTFGEYHSFSGPRIGWRLHPGDASHLD